MVIEPLKHENAVAHFDSESRIAHITYRGFLTAEASTAVYDWLADLTESIGMETFYGEIFDFREVTDFMPDNLITARKKSRRRNLSHDVRGLPVAMIVKDFYQQEILRGPMQNVENNPRKAIVRTPEEARAFLDAWHARNQSQNDESNEPSS